MHTVQELRVVVIQEGDVYVAQCLEHDICTQGPDIETLRARMDCLLEVELGEGQVIDPAPQRFHKMWDRAQSLSEGPEYRLAA